MFEYDYEDPNFADILLAEELVEKAFTSQEKGEHKTAVTLFIKAVNQLVYAGIYTVGEIFNRFISKIRKESVIYSIREEIYLVLDKLKNLDIPEEEAKLKMALGDLACKSKDYHNSANYFKEVAELFSKADANYFRKSISMSLMRAAECLEKINKIEKSTELVMQAIKIIDISNYDLEDNLLELRKKCFYKSDIEKQRNLPEALKSLEEMNGFIMNLISEMEELFEETNDESYDHIKPHVQARIIQMNVELAVIKMAIHKDLGEEDEVKDIAKRGIHQIIEAIDILKEQFKQGLYSTVDLHKMTFSLFILQFFQEFSGQQIEDPIDVVMGDLPSKIKKILVKMKYYKKTEYILKYDLYGNVEIFEDMEFSAMLEPFRDYILKYI